MEQDASLPKRIKALDTQLVNRIAAGEIIQRPFNALKELIENSLDAGSTSINVQIKEGGLKLIQIQDNGCGIDKDDLKIVCERFTTSKLKEFDDLTTLNTFGFRGEALASISHVSRLTIVTKTQNSSCAYKAQYADGKLIGNGIRPCAAASKGTQITAEDLFYNSLIRRNALRSSSEEFAKIYETVSRYAIHNYHVSFFLKRSNENGFDLKTKGLTAPSPQQQVVVSERCIDNEKTLIENIGIVFGNELSKELERVSLPYDDSYKFEMMGYITNAKYSNLKQIIFILFINERLVDCQPLRKTLQTLFALYMPKTSYPFIYMNLKINSYNLDVNVHPTKHEVRFLFQDEIINKIQICIEEKLLNSNLSRTYLVKNLTIETFLPPNSDKTCVKSVDSDGANKDSPIVYPYQQTRVDSKERTLDSYKHRNSLNTSQQRVAAVDETILTDDLLKSSPLRKQKFDREIKLKSLNELREIIENNASLKARKILIDFNFVGCLDYELGLVQHQTGLYIVNTRNLSQELFYQLTCFNFGNFGYFRFNQPIRIFDLATHALNNPDAQWCEEDGEKEYLAHKCEKLFYSKRGLLDDYFSIKITQDQDDDVYIGTLPMLLEDYVPNLNELSMFILRLATEVDWSSEKNCLKTICTELSVFYSIKHDEDNSDSMNETLNTSIAATTTTKTPNREWIIEHIIYPSFRNYLLPSTKCEESFYKLVDLHDLYKVFERC